VLNISTTLSGVISHTRLFVTGQLRNPCQMLAEPLGSAEPRLKITDLTYCSCSNCFEDTIYKEKIKIMNTWGSVGSPSTLSDAPEPIWRAGDKILHLQLSEIMKQTIPTVFDD